MPPAFSDLFAFDLDGTLVHRDDEGQKCIPKDLLSEVFRLSKSAHLVIATGRRYRAAEPELRMLPKMPYCVVHNGLVIKDEKGMTVFERKLETGLAIEITQLLEEKALDCFYVCNGFEVGIDFLFVESSLARSETLQIIHKKGGENSAVVSSIEELSQFTRAPLVEVAALGRYEQLLEIQKELRRELPKPYRPVVVQNIGVPGWGALEIFPDDCSKWTGVEDVKRRLGAQRVIAVGDDENDLEMLEWSDIGVAMAHSAAHVQRAADLHVEGPLGLVRFLKEFDQ